VVSPASHRVLRARWYSGTRRVDRRFSNTGLSPSTAGLSRLALLNARFCNYSGLLPCPYPVLQLPVYNAGRLHTYTEFGLFPVRSPLLRELFLFFGVLRCFSSPTCLTLSSKRGVPAHHGGGLPHSEISGSACQRLPGAFRSVTTSFFGPGCQGIHHMPLFACDSSAFPLRSPPRYRVANLRVHAETVVKQLFLRALLWSLISHLIGVVVFRLVRNWFPTASTSPPTHAYGQHAEAFACYSLLGILLVMCCLRVTFV
jgi:hypothetical protein